MRRVLRVSSLTMNGRVVIFSRLDVLGFQSQGQGVARQAESFPVNGEGKVFV